jgi:hypothetical protein
MSAAAVKVCPPSMNGERFDSCQFPRINKPVGAHYIGHGEWESTSGLSFDDYQNAQTYSRKLFSSRRFKTPDWAVNDTMLRRVISEYLIQRSYGHKHWKAALPSDAENDIAKIRWAEGLLAARVPSLHKLVDSLCNEYVELRHSGADPARLRKLESLIGNLDSQIIFNRQPARIVASVVYSYFRMGQTSVGVAESVGLHPPAVRQLLRRIWLAAERCGYEERERIARCSSKQQALDEAQEKNPPVMAG